MKILSTNRKEQKLAQIPHELFTFNIIVVHILFPAGLMKLGEVQYLGFSLLFSLLIIAFTYWKTKKIKATDSYFIYLHWQYALNWYKPVLIIYGVSIVIALLGMFIASNSQGSMQSIIKSIFTLLSLVPLFFTILSAFVVESGLMFSAGRGEVQQKLIDKYPKI
jgi:uncharacterized Tic20 family protein